MKCVKALFLLFSLSVSVLNASLFSPDHKNNSKNVINSTFEREQDLAVSHSENETTHLCKYQSSYCQSRHCIKHCHALHLVFSHEFYWELKEPETNGLAFSKFTSEVFNYSNVILHPPIRTIV